MIGVYNMAFLCVYVYFNRNKNIFISLYKIFVIFDLCSLNLFCLKGYRKIRGGTLVRMITTNIFAIIIHNVVCTLNIKCKVYNYYENAS